jgi:uncharacterized protein involved in tolerance to divalent cations
MKTYKIIDKDTKTKDLLLIIKTEATKKEVNEIVKQVQKIDGYTVDELIEAFEKHEKTFIIDEDIEEINF